MYMQHTVNSKKEKIKRNLVDLIDNLHSDEMKGLEHDLKGIA